jgi:hypothetical protein
VHGSPDRVILLKFTQRVQIAEFVTPAVGTRGASSENAGIGDGYSGICPGSYSQASRSIEKRQAADLKDLQNGRC